MPSIDSFIAEPRLRAALAAEPADAAALAELARVCAAKTEFAEALELCDRLCAIRPDDHDTRLLRADLLRGLDRMAEALAEAELVIVARPQSFEAHQAAGDAAFALGEFQRARVAYGQCCMLRPTESRPFIGLAATAAKLGAYADAMRVRADQVAFTLPEMHENLLVLSDFSRAAGQIDDAVAVMRTARLIFPHSAAIAEQHARVLVHACRAAEAEEELKRAGDLGGSGGGVEMARAAIHHVSGRRHQAVEAAARAAELTPDDKSVQMNLALMRMTLGQWEEGWRGYDARLDQLRWADYDRLWQGEQIDGTLLVAAEQGLGDQIQGLRYLPLIRPRVGRLAVVVADPLARLIRDIPGIDEVRPLSAGWPDYDRVVPIMSLGRIFDRDQPGTAAVPIPFLRPPAETSVGLPDGPGLKIGLCWAGNPTFAMDNIRSMPASEIARLIRRVPGARYFSLHRGPTAPFVGRLSDDLPIIDAIRDCADYADTAAVIDALDLVVTVDTSVAHLAGALGKETWLLLPFVSCFRWGHDAETTPLYPSMRLFRQPRQDEGWAETMDEVARRLAERMAEQSVAQS